MSKRFKTLLLTGVLTLGLGVVGCNKEKESEDFKVTLVLDEGGVNDESFNQSAWNGAKAIEEKYGVEIGYIESKQESDYIQNIESAIDNGSDVVVGVGFKIADKMLEAAENYPDTKFVMIDATYEEIPENMVTTTFNEEESGYLAGLVAGKMSKSNKFGFVGGMDIPTVSQFAVGYEKALKEINPENELLIQYANSFTDSAKGKAIAQTMYKQDVEIIFTAGGGVNTGVFESARELKKYAVGVDLPCSKLAPENIITSALKNINIGVEKSVESAINGTFEGGKNVVYSLENGGVGYEKTDLIPEDIIEFVDGKMAK